ncbi:unnamed protein product [Bursaphelenchus okinawaensis]|uniref:Tubulin/FtsZ 2-layer sandwich domain-containing protein n=1 Tax=Bursaphelenchus okinawaensis TaxID=465554 RepID=A0A811LUW8_9BILA|nr:unnamed protein product [Bursaphelenchus okinawaensis]CAG9128020.1 unnamed protein product [Bursaphelenchus okinawaensis]
MVNVVDNKALDKMAEGVGKMDATFKDTNSMIAQIMRMASSPFMDVNSSTSTIQNLIEDLCPLPRLHFISTACFPCNLPGRPIIAPKTTATDTLRRVLQPKSLMISTTDELIGKIVAGIVVFEGSRDDIDVIRIGKDAALKYQNLFMAIFPVKEQQIVCLRQKVDR